MRLEHPCDKEFEKKEAQLSPQTQKMFDDAFAEIGDMIQKFQKKKCQKQARKIADLFLQEIKQVIKTVKMKPGEQRQLGTKLRRTALKVLWPEPKREKDARQHKSK